MKILNTMTRVYLNPSELDQTISFYEHLFNKECSMRFYYEETGLELASVGSMLLIAGSKENLQPFKDTKTTFLVDSVDEYREFLINEGAEIIEAPQQVPTGKNMHVRHADGTKVEYVEHKAQNE